MIKKYYEELEVSQTASKEVIEKAYKVLAKKYHPDTTQETDKKAAEERFKKISEAYEILSNDEKRNAYDLELKQSSPSVSFEDYQDMVMQKEQLTHAYQNLQEELKQVKSFSTSPLQGQPPHQNTASQYASYQQKSVSNASSKKRTYYYTNTGKPASALAYYVYKIKQFFSNFGIFLLAIAALLLMLNAMEIINLFDFFFKK